MKLVFLLSAALLFIGLNYRQLYSAWAIRSETKRLTALAEHATDGFRNPAPMGDFFDEKLCPHFWKFTIINGNGKVSNEAAWHSAAMSCADGVVVLNENGQVVLANRSPKLTQIYSWADKCSVPASTSVA